MNSSSRYQIQKVYAEQGEITTFKGIDPLTGLPVLIYRFAARPTVGAGILESENIPGILASSFDGSYGQVVAAYSSDYLPVAKLNDLSETTLLLDTARALRDAARAGVAHGDLRPERFLSAAGHVLVEGYGVPWKPAGKAAVPPEFDGAGSLGGDVFAWAQAMRSLGVGNGEHGDKHGKELQALLNECSAPLLENRPTAEEIYDRLSALLVEPERTQIYRTGEAPAAKTPTLFDLSLDPADSPAESRAAKPQRGGNRVAPSLDTEIDLPLDFAASRKAAGEGAAASPPTDPLPAVGAVVGDLSDLAADAAETSSGRATAAATPTPTGTAAGPLPADHDPDEPEPLVVNTDPGAETPPPGGGQLLTRSNQLEREPKFIKDLPPGARYRAGSLDDAPRPAPVLPKRNNDDNQPRRGIDRRGFLLGLLILGGAALAYLAFLRQGLTDVTTPQTTQAVRYIVEVQIEPPTLPPVDLVVVASPPGSELTPGTELGQVISGRKIVLDQEGSWSFQGSFLDRRSEVVTIEIPSERVITLVIPSDEEDGLR